MGNKADSKRTNSSEQPREPGSDELSLPLTEKEKERLKGAVDRLLNIASVEAEGDDPLNPPPNLS